MFWAFPETVRSCVVEEITLVTAPLVPLGAGQRATLGPDWTQRTDTLIQRMRRWDYEPNGWLAQYFVTVRLLERDQ